MLYLFFFLTIALGAPTGKDRCSLTSRRADKDLRIFLVTLSPGAQLWSAFGHSTLWVSDGRTGRDESYNWGTFDPNQPNLLGSYLNGTLRYWLNVEPYARDLHRYNKVQDRTVTAQRLDLPEKELETLLELVKEERKPENREFIYHWVRNSCATKIRDRIDEALGGQLYRQLDVGVDATLRQEALRHLWNKPLIWFGWNYIASSWVDRPSSKWELMYSPVMMKEAADEASILWPDGSEKPLVSYTCTAKGGLEWAPEEPPSWSLHLFAIGSGCGLMLGLLSWMTRKRAGRPRAGRYIVGAAISAIGTGAGLFGLVHAGLFWSALEGLHPNANQLLCSPLHLAWIPAGIAIMRGRRGWPTKAVGGGAVLAALALLIKLSPLGTQDNLPLISLFLPLYTGLWMAARLQEQD
jgi:hypothetical protein